MRTISFDQIHERVAAFHAIHNAPKPAAIRAVYALIDQLAELSPQDRADVVQVFADEVTVICAGSDELAETA